MITPIAQHAGEPRDIIYSSTDIVKAALLKRYELSRSVLCLDCSCRCRTGTNSDIHFAMKPLETIWCEDSHRRGTLVIGHNTWARRRGFVIPESMPACSSGRLKELSKILNFTTLEPATVDF